MARRRKGMIPTSKYASTRRRRARRTKVKLSMYVPQYPPIARDRDTRAAYKPLGVKQWTSRIDSALARIARPPKPAKGYPRPVHDPRAKRQQPVGWTYGWLDQGSAA